jgi:Fe-S oxidoreductase
MRRRPLDRERWPVDDGLSKEEHMQATEAPFEVVDRKDLVPICPHCEGQLHEVYSHGKGFPLGQGRTVVFFCSHCHKTLGFAVGRMI